MRHLIRAASVVASSALVLVAMMVPSAASAVTSSAPTQWITGGNTQLARATDIAFDGLGNIYVANSAWGDGAPSVTVYAAGATGNVAPIQLITGSNTQLVNPGGIAVDANWIYVSDLSSGTISVFPLSATGDIAPTQRYVIGGMPFGLDLSANGDLAVATSTGVVIYRDIAQGVGNATTFTDAAVAIWTYDVAWDQADGLYATQSDEDKVIYLDPNSAAGAAPTRTLQRSTTLPGYPHGVAVRPGTGEVLVSDYQANNVYGWTSSIDGTPEPAFTVSSNDSDINGPNGIAFGPDNQLGVVLYGNGNAVLVYPDVATDGSSLSSGTSQLPDTGTNSSSLLAIAGIALMVGLGILVLVLGLARRRTR